MDSGPSATQQGVAKNPFAGTRPQGTSPQHAMHIAYQSEDKKSDQIDRSAIFC
jgi:hypothetical protein